MRIKKEALQSLKHEWNYKKSSNMLMMHNMNIIDYISDQLAEQRKKVKK